MALPLYVMPDVTKMVVGFLRAQVELTALLPAEQIRGQLGDAPTFPALRVTRITDTEAVAEPPILDEVSVQIDVWGGNNRQAERIYATALAALRTRGPGYGNDEGYITKVKTGGGGSLPDEAFSPPRERYLGTISVWTKPILS